MASNNEAKVKFTAETSDFNDSIKAANSELASLRAEMKLNQAEFENTGDSTEYLSTKSELLAAQLEANHDKQEALTGKLEVARDVYGEDSEEVAKLERQLTYAQTEEQKLLTQVNETNNGLTEQESAAGDAGSSIDTMAELMANAEIVSMIEDIAQAAWDMAEAYDEACAVIVEGTGATGDALDELNESAKEAFGNIKDSDADLSSVSAILAELNTRFGVTGDEATEMTTKIANFAQHTGTDGVNAVDAIADITKRWGLDIDDVDGLLDDLTTANQSCQMSVDELSRYLSDNSVQFQELGYSTEDALALLISLSDGGANVSTVMSGMKKAVSNLSETTNDVPGAFQAAIDAIAECDSVSEALQAQVGDTGLTVEDVFGTRAAQELAANVQNGCLNIDEWTAALENNQGSLEQTTEDATTMEDAWSQAANNMKMALSDTLSPAISDVVTNFAGIVTKVAEIIEDSPVLQSVITGVAIALGVLAAALAITNIISAVQKAMTLLNTTMLTNPIFLVVTAIAALAAGLIYAYNHCEKFREVVDTAFNAVKTVIQTIVEAIVGFIQNFIDKVQEIWDKITDFKDTVAEIFGNIGDTISDTLSVAGEDAENTLQNMRNAFEEHGGGITGIAAAVMEGVKGYFQSGFDILDTLTGGRLSDIKDMFDSALGDAVEKVKNRLEEIKTAFTDKLDAAKEVVSNAIETIKGFFDFDWSLPNIKLPHFKISGSFSLNPPSVPSFGVEWYAKGGILTSPTIFGSTGNTLLGGGEAGPEAVAPISVLQDYVVDAVEGCLGDSIAQLASAMEDVANRPIELNINGRAFATATAGDVDGALGTRSTLTARGLCLS